MYVQIEKFGIDKALAAAVEESGMAEAYIREYHRRHGRKVWRVEKNLGDYRQQRLYDLRDNLGVTWEVKFDRKSHLTGNVYLEQQALDACAADKYLIFACGKAYVAPKTALCEAIASGTALTPGGDRNASLGLKLSLERLEEISEQVITL